MPIDTDSMGNQPQVKVMFSEVAELIAVIHTLADNRHHEFLQEFADHIYKKLSKESLGFLEVISGLNFPGTELYGFLIKDRIFDSVDMFLNKVSSYDDIDFIYLSLDREVTKERIEAARNNKDEFPSLMDSLCCTWQGKPGPMEALVYDTGNFKKSLIKLATEIYNDELFKEIVERNESLYKASIEDFTRRLENKAPVELAEEIKGKTFPWKLDYYEQHIFIPSYFLHNHNLVGCDGRIFIMFYNTNNNVYIKYKEIDEIVSVLKILSDNTRLQILAHIKDRPAYGKVLAESLKLTTATISRHLDQLRSMNLVVEEKADNIKYFKLNNYEIEKFIEKFSRFFKNS